jgi:hypothetical protein
MLTFAIISTIMLIISLVFLVLLYKKYIGVSKGLKSLSDTIKSSQRIGFFDEVLDHKEYGKGFATIRVNCLEKEKYEDDYSKVEYLEVEYMHGPGGFVKDAAVDFVKQHLTEIIKTSSVTWLTIEESLKQKRLKKLEELGL